MDERAPTLNHPHLLFRFSLSAPSNSFSKNAEWIAWPSFLASASIVSHLNRVR